MSKWNKSKSFIRKASDENALADNDDDDSGGRSVPIAGNNSQLVVNLRRAH